MTTGKKVWIYGLYSADGKCQYVGKSTCPEKRFIFHKVSKPFRDTSMRILFETTEKDGPESESKFIVEAKARGEAQHNKQVAIINQGGVRRRNFAFQDYVWEEAKRQAKAANRSVSNYLSTLVLERKQPQ